MRAFVARGVRDTTAGIHSARDRERGATFLWRNKKEETRDVMAVRVKGGGEAKGKGSPRGNGEAGHHVNESPRVWLHYGPKTIETPRRVSACLSRDLSPYRIHDLMISQVIRFFNNRAGPSRSEPLKRRPLPLICRKYSVYP